MIERPFDKAYAPPPVAVKSMEVVVQFKTVVCNGAMDTTGGVLF